MKLKILTIVLVVVFCRVCRVDAETTATSVRYYTNFSDDRSADFCDAALGDDRYSSYSGTTLSYFSANANHEFAAGYMRLYGKYALSMSQALKAGGGQWVDANDDPQDVTVGEDANGAILEPAYGVFTNAQVSMTYQLYNPLQPDHTDINVRLGLRKQNSPYLYRNPVYYIEYNGVRLSIKEYTYVYGVNTREIAGTNITISANSSIFKIVATMNGGNDNNGVISGADPVQFTAEFWEGGSKLASLSGSDNPFDWSNGPELSGAVFNPAGDYGNGAWNPYAGDWTTSQSWSRGNRDISMNGWIVIYCKQAINSGTWQGITVTELDVNSNWMQQEVKEGTLIRIQ